jgi:hypothetical protein
MDIFILDALLRPIDVVDQYISFVWTERWSTMGDFILETLATPNNRRRFVPDAMLSIPQSKRVMIIEKVEEVDKIEEGNALKITGRCLNSELERRVAARMSIATGQISTSWDTIYAAPPELIEYYFFEVCYNNPLQTGDVFPFLQPSTTPSLYPAENISVTYPSDFQWSIKPMNLYAALQTLTTAYEVGFRFYKDPNASKLYFEAVQGCDRTTRQSTYTPVIFSHDMANLIDTTNITDKSTYYNAVWMIYSYKDASNDDAIISQYVTAPDLSLSGGGFQQKTKMVTITQIPDGMALVDVPAYLTQLGQAELGRSQTLNVYDGEVAQNSGFLYERDYNLGDIVEVRGDDGGIAYMRVVEQIFKNDQAGYATYPSLVIKDFVTPGTWASWKYDIEWSAMGSGEYWATQ